MKKKLANRLTARLSMAGVLASVMLMAFPAFAQDSRLSLAERVSRLEQQSQDRDKGGIGLVNQIQALQSQLQQQQGQIEELQHHLQQLQDTSKAQYIDLDSRLSRVSGGASGGSALSAAPSASAPTGELPASGASASSAGASAAAAAAPASGASAAAPVDSPAVQSAYSTAFNLLRNGKYAEASRSFREFIQQYPDSALTANAWYWLGESYYVTTNYPVALQSFQHLLSQFPGSEKAPDALLKVGYTQIELKHLDAAKAALQKVISTYPQSNAAGLAKERLSRIQLQSAS